MEGTRKQTRQICSVEVVAEVWWMKWGGSVGLAGVRDRWRPTARSLPARCTRPPARRQLTIASNSDSQLPLQQLYNMLGSGEHSMCGVSYVLVG